MPLTGTIKVIDDIKYEVWLLPVPEAQRIALKLAKKLGKLLGDAAGGLKMSDPDAGGAMTVDPGIIGKAISGLTDSLDEAEFHEVSYKMLAYVFVETPQGSSKFVKVQPDVQFQGKILHMMKVVGAAIEVNFSDFSEGFGGVQGLVQKLLGMIPGPSTSIPPSGGSGSADEQH